MSADFFPGEGKNFPRVGGQEPLFAKKTTKKNTIFHKKSLKTYYFWPALAGQGGGQEPPLPSPADAHGGFQCWKYGGPPKMNTQSLAVHP